MVTYPGELSRRRVFVRKRLVRKPRRLLTAALLACVALLNTRATCTTVHGPILFVTQTPFKADFTTITSPFGNQKGDTQAAPRGGDLWIQYPDGVLRNLTQEAGYGVQTGQEIAVREPSVRWNGKKAIFSMVVGGTTKNDYSPVFWQMYEVSGIEEGSAATITKVANQPTSSNNVSPLYGTDGRIIFTSDRPRSGDPLTYPQRDEYESAPTTTGLWSMDSTVAGGDLKIIEHTVSGAFSPFIAQDGRLLFMRWDHLQRDQQADSDTDYEAAHPGQTEYGSFDYVSETSSTHASPTRTEIFPEPRVHPVSPAHPFTINQFIPWQILEDGSSEETLNHIGRQELLGYIDSSRDGLPDFNLPQDRLRLINSSFIQPKEDPTVPGRLFAVDVPEFSTHGSGQVVRLDGAESINADDMRVTYVTHPNTASYVQVGQTPPSPHDGFFRSPTPLTTGSVLVVHTPTVNPEQSGGNPLGSNYYAFRLQYLDLKNDGSGYSAAGAFFTTGISKSLTYWDNYSYQQLSYNGPMWELDPVEVTVRTKPVTRQATIPDIETNLLNQLLASDGGIPALRQYLVDNNLALVISRNITRRADEQQPFNLGVPNGTSTSQPGAPIEQVKWVQFFQGDLVRGYSVLGGGGRRPLARVMHDAPAFPGAPAGSYPIASDGSFAALVPARRAMSWQMLGPDGQTPVVRERYWVSFAPGEIRVCTNCHGINKADVVLGQPAPTNPPAALAGTLGMVF